MATFLDTGLLNSFSTLFTFLFIFVTSYAVLNKVNFPKDSKGLQSLTAFTLAVITSLSGGVVELISTMTPWFIIMFLVIMFLIIANMIFGVDENYISEGFKKDSVISTWILIVSGIIILASFATVYSDTLLSFTGSTQSSATGDIGHNVGAAIFHPKMLGLIVVLLVGVFTILFMSKTDK